LSSILLAINTQANDKLQNSQPTLSTEDWHTHYNNQKKWKAFY